MLNVYVGFNPVHGAITMGIPARAMLGRFRASSISFGEAAASVLLGKGRIPMLTLHSTATLHVCASSSSIHGSLCNEPRFRFYCPKFQVIGIRSYTSSCSIARRPSGRTSFGFKQGRPSEWKNFGAKSGVHRRSSGEFQAGKFHRGNAAKRSPSAISSSGYSFRKPASMFASSKKTISADSDGETHSRKVLTTTDRTMLTRTSKSHRRPAIGLKAMSKTAVRKSREKLRNATNIKNEIETDSSKAKEDTSSVPDAKKKVAETDIKKKSSKKMKAANKDEEENRRRRGKKVIMRLDPKDITSKRYVEGYPLPGEVVNEDDSLRATGRVQFRSIVPNPKLMQHIQKYLLGRRRPAELQRAGYDLKIAPAPLDNIPFTKKGERQPTHEEIFRHKLRFAAAAKTLVSFPPPEIPEVAFAGRSNVGKSSLINALTRQWGVARTSDKPGLTQSINFFRLGGRLCLVDLPGYGFAYAKEEKIEAWEELVKEFVTTRNDLKRVYVLVDAKWGLKLRDEELIQLMERAGTKYQIVLTKSDTVTPADLGRRATQIQEIFKDNRSLVLPIVMVSSKTGEGLEYFRSHVARLAKPSLI